MLEIAKEVLAKNSDIYFMVVGDGDELVGLQERTKDYKIADRVIFVGLQDDIRPFYRDADVTLICSLREGLSLTAYESCAMMTPVITADVGGQHELIDNSIGVVLPLLQKEQDIEKKKYSQEEIMQYVNSILYILDNANHEKYAHMCELSRKKIEQYFGLDTMIKNMEKAIDDCFSAERIVRRQKCAESFAMFPSLAADLFSMYIVYEGMEQENSRVWNERCYFQNKLDEEKLRNVILEEDNKSMRNSTSLCVGRTITFIPRKFRGGVYCIKDHGFLYTVKYALKKAIR